MRISDWSSDVCSSDLARLTGRHLAVGFDFGDAGDLERGAELLGGGAFVARFAQLLAGRNEAFGARLLAALDAVRGDMRLFGKAGAAIIAARLGISGARRGDQASEGERRSRDDGESGGKAAEKIGRASGRARGGK